MNTKGTLEELPRIRNLPADSLNSAKSKIQGTGVAVPVSPQAISHNGRISRYMHSAPYSGFLSIRPGFPEVLAIGIEGPDGPSCNCTLAGPDWFDRYFQLLTWCFSGHLWLFADVASLRQKI